LKFDLLAFLPRPLGRWIARDCLQDSVQSVGAVQHRQWGCAAEVGVCPNQPIGDHLILPVTSHGADHTSDVRTDSVIVELEVEIDFFGPRAAESEQVGAVRQLGLRKP
jgi:hypothetical protein